MASKMKRKKLGAYRFHKSHNAHIIPLVTTY